MLDVSVLGMSVFGGFMLLLLLVVNIAPPSTSIRIGKQFNKYFAWYILYKKTSQHSAHQYNKDV